MYLSRAQGEGLGSPEQPPSFDSASLRWHLNRDLEMEARTTGYRRKNTADRVSHCACLIIQRAGQGHCGWTKGTTAAKLANQRHS